MHAACVFLALRASPHPPPASVLLNPPLHTSPVLFPPPPKPGVWRDNSSAAAAPGGVPRGCCENTPERGRRSAGIRSDRPTAGLAGFEALLAARGGQSAAPAGSDRGAAPPSPENERGGAGTAPWAQPSCAWAFGLAATPRGEDRPC